MNKANWYLKHVIINDLTTNGKYFFVCQRWLAVEQDDGQLERIIPSAGESEKTNLKYLMKKETKDKLSDDHLWYSLIARPIPSSFGRLDRLTCIFVLLCVSMLANIMYYGTDRNTSNPNALNIGPFTLSPEQIGIGIMTNLIVFPPTFILMQIFRRARDRHQEKLDQVLKKPKKK
jgi:polycystin 1L2